MKCSIRDGESFSSKTVLWDEVDNDYPAATAFSCTETEYLGVALVRCRGAEWSGVARVIEIALSPACAVSDFQQGNPY